MNRTLRGSGQSAAEFTLIVPVLFLLFFCVIQLAYAVFAALAVQRAALSVARNASLGGTTDRRGANIRVAAALLPIARLDHRAALTVLETRCHLTLSGDKRKVTARVSYPMPLWVPLAGKVLGEPLTPSFHLRSGPEKRDIDSILSLLKRPGNGSRLESVRLPVRWITREATTFNESHVMENNE